MAIKLKNVFPDLAVELTQIVHDEDLGYLSDQIGSLNVVNRCRCGDYFCASIYTAPPPDGAWEGELEGIQPEESNLGIINIDLIDKQIVYIEIHHNEPMRAKLKELFP